MNQPWVILTKRHGGDIRAPTEKQLADALQEIYADAIAHQPIEYGSAVLSVGSDDGPMYVLEIVSDGDVHYEEWKDQDCEIELSPQRKMGGISREQALQLWKWLAHGQVAKVRSQPWSSTV